MLDPAFLRDDIYAIRAGLKKRGADFTF